MIYKWALLLLTAVLLMGSGCSEDSSDIGGTASNNTVIDLRKSSSYNASSTESPSSATVQVKSFFAPYYGDYSNLKTVGSVYKDVQGFVIIAYDQANAHTYYSIKMDSNEVFVKKIANVQKMADLLNKIDTSNTLFPTPKMGLDSAENGLVVMLQMAFSQTLAQKNKVQIQLGAAKVLLPYGSVIRKNFSFVGQNSSSTQIYLDVNNGFSAQALQMKDSTALVYVSVIGSGISVNIDSASVSLENAELKGSNNLLSGLKSDLLWNTGRSLGWRFSLTKTTADVRNVEQIYSNSTKVIWQIDSSVVDFRSILSLNKTLRIDFLQAIRNSKFTVNLSEIDDYLRVDSSSAEVRNSTLWSGFKNNKSTLKCIGANDSLGALTSLCGH